MPGSAFLAAHDLAIDQFGYFTTEQARRVGLDHRALAMMCRRGALTREAFGLYRDPLVPPHPLATYMAATLWPCGTRGVLSHETALALLDLSDANPAKIHITVPKAFRIRREVPEPYVLHHADLRGREQSVVEGIPVTSAARAIRDCYRTHLGPALLDQAIEDGLRKGRLTRQEAEDLAREVLGDKAGPDTAP